MPTFQRREVVRDAIQTLCRLEYRGDIQIIVVIDGSTDGTAHALRSLDCPYPLHILEIENGGAARARNRGAELATGDIILFLDDDMMCEPDLLEQHARMFPDGADAVTGDVYVDPRSPDTFVTESLRRWISLPRPSSPVVPFHIYTGHLSVRRPVFREIGGFDEDFTAGPMFGHEDTDFGVKLLARYVVRHNSEAVTRQRYIVGPREIMQRASRAAAADVRFVTKYPQFAKRLFEDKGRSNWKTRWIYLPVSRIPLVARILAAIAVWIAEPAVKTGFRRNRLLSNFFFAARATYYWSELRKAGGIPNSRSFLILCYHAIQDQSADPVLAPYGVPLDRFVGQIKALLRRGFVFIGPGAVADFINLGAPLPRRAVLLTFDDCYRDLLDVARAKLRPARIEALAFAVTNIKSSTNEWDQRHGAGSVELLEPDDLRELNSLGVEIGAHSRTHRPLPNLDADEQKIEADGARKDLMAQGLPCPRFFAYPYGAHDSTSVRAVRDAGYLAAFGIGARHASRSSDPFLLPRVPVLASDNPLRFRVKTRFPGLLEWADLNFRRASKLFAYVTPARVA